MKKEIQWKSIQFLPTMISLIAGDLDNVKEQYESLLEVKDKPHVLNDQIVDRIIKLYTEKINEHWYYEKQIQIWSETNLTEKQKGDIERLNSWIHKIKEINERVLELAKLISENTIDKILAKDDMELALEVLSGKRKLPL